MLEYKSTKSAPMGILCPKCPLADGKCPKAHLRGARRLPAAVTALSSREETHGKDLIRKLLLLLHGRFPNPPGAARRILLVRFFRRCSRERRCRRPSRQNSPIAHTSRRKRLSAPVPDAYHPPASYIGKDNSFSLRKSKVHGI